MLRLTPHDSSALTRLVQFYRLPDEKRQEILDDVKDPDARLVGEAVLDPEKYKKSPDDVRATVDQFKGWLEANMRIGSQRRARRKSRN